MATNSSQTAQQWLKQLAKTGGRWQRLAKLAAFGQALCIVLQAWLIARLLHAVIIDKHNASQLVPLFAFAAGVIVLRYVLAWCRENAAMRASHQTQQALRQELIDQLYQLGPVWRSKQRGGELVSQLQEQVAAVDGYLAKYLPQMGLVSTVPLFIIIAVFPLSWAAALIFLFTAPLIPIFMIMVGWKAKDKQIEQQQQLARMSGHFLDQLRGLPTLQLFNRHREQADVIANVADDFRQRTMSVLSLAFLSSTVLEFFASVAIALLAVYLGFSFLGYFNFGLYGEPLTLATAFFILLLAPEFYQPLRDLGTFYHANAEAEAAAEQLHPWIMANSAQLAGGTQTPPTGAINLQLNHIDFAYDDDNPLLTHANLTLAAGKTTVLMGNSGTGKTTVLRLLLGQLTPTKGEILIDGQPLDKLNIHAWREQIGWLSQHPHLLSDSLRANLTVAAPHADDAQLLAALNFAELDQWFAQLPQGLETPLGEDGRPLSGGQLRRLALARVYLSDANILLFDEPTASLDNDLEAKLLHKLSELFAHKTVLLLTHRTAPLSLADSIVYLDNGQFCTQQTDGSTLL